MFNFVLDITSVVAFYCYLLIRADLILSSSLVSFVFGQLTIWYDAIDCNNPLLIGCSIFTKGANMINADMVKIRDLLILSFMILYGSLDDWVNSQFWLVSFDWFINLKDNFESDIVLILSYYFVIGQAVLSFFALLFSFFLLLVYIYMYRVLVFCLSI